MDNNIPTILSGTEALQAFRKQYPSVNSGDLQTFTLGWHARDAEVEELVRALALLLDYPMKHPMGWASVNSPITCTFPPTHIKQALDILTKYNKTT